MDPNLVKDLHKVDKDILKSGYDNTTEILNSGERRNDASEAREYKNTLHVLSDINDFSAHNLNATERSGADVMSNVHLSANRIDTDLYRISGDISNSISKSAQELHDNINNTQSDVKTLLSIVGLEIQKNANLVMNTFNDNYKDYTTDITNITKDVLKNKNDSLLCATSHLASIQTQQTIHAGQIQFEALKEKAAIEKEMADYHSKVKANTIQSESAIKAKVQKHEVDRILDLLRSNEKKSVFFELNNSGIRHH